MKETSSNKYQLLSDGQRVWVNGLQGESVARLSRFGSVVMIDIHQPLCAQKTNGECLDCRHDLQGYEAWLYFISSLKRNFNIDVDEAHRPKWAS
jgi:hypothetical protein